MTMTVYGGRRRLSGSGRTDSSRVLASA